MTAPDEHEVLVEAVASKITETLDGKPWDNDGAARAVLALVAARLEKPTEAMIEAWKNTDPNGPQNELAEADWSAMLAASPLKPKGKENSHKS